jgi:hypothetical protein
VSDATGWSSINMRRNCSTPGASGSQVRRLT